MNSTPLSFITTFPSFNLKSHLMSLPNLTSHMLLAILWPLKLLSTQHCNKAMVSFDYYNEQCCSSKYAASKYLFVAYMCIAKLFGIAIRISYSNSLSSLYGDSYFFSLIYLKLSLASYFNLFMQLLYLPNLYWPFVSNFRPSCITILFLKSIILSINHLLSFINLSHLMHIYNFHIARNSNY